MVFGATAHAVPAHVSGLTGIFLLTAALGRWLGMDLTPAIVAVPIAAWASVHWVGAHKR